MSGDFDGTLNFQEWFYELLTQALRWVRLLCRLMAGWLAGCRIERHPHLYSSHLCTKASEWPTTMEKVQFSLQIFVSNM
jgi:hypothetical protein